MNAQRIPITFPDADYLKHAGDIENVKVTIRIVDGFPMIFIRDSEFCSFRQALAYLQHIANSEVVSTTHFHVICAWCKKVLDDFDGNGDSHGICEECATKVQAEDEAVIRP